MASDSRIRFLEALGTRVLVADGAMGTELQRAGLPPGQPGDRWTRDHPDRVEAIHRAYAEAGADLILTNTFGTNPWVLARYGLADAIDELAQAAARAARRALRPDGFVVGDIGPTGALLAPLGDGTPEQFGDASLRLARALLAGGADGIIVETMTALEEAVAAVAAACEAGAPFVIASMAFDRIKDGSFRTMMGVRPEQAARALLQAGATVVGANCGTNMSVADFAQLTTVLRAAVDCPLMIQPNAGKPELVDGAAVYRLSPQAFADGVREVVAAGARIVGGCCGTTPAHIGALRQMVSSTSQSA
ncbi:MAG: homocysteine S-methyltransferase family protein [Bacteroidales bacterium]